MDVTPCVSVKECHLFGHGDHLGSGLGEVVAVGCPSAWGALANGLIKVMMTIALIRCGKRNIDSL